MAVPAPLAAPALLHSLRAMSNATAMLLASNVQTASAPLATVDSWHSIDFWASVLCFVGGIVSAAGGVGGGGLYVPVLILLGGLSSTAAVPVSTAIIFGNAFASLAFNADMRHPIADRPLIDLQVVLLLSHDTTPPLQYYATTTPL